MGFSLLKKLAAQISLFPRIKSKADFIDQKKGIRKTGVEYINDHKKNDSVF